METSSSAATQALIDDVWGVYFARFAAGGRAVKLNAPRNSGSHAARLRTAVGAESKLRCLITDEA